MAGEQLALSWDRLESAGKRHGVQPRHREALKAPAPGFELALVSLLRGLAQYADAHRARYGDTIREDYVIGESWVALGRAALGLLDGELGRLDGGVLHGFILRLIESDTEAAATRAVLSELAPEPPPAVAAAAPVARAARAAKAKAAPEPSAIGVRALNPRQRELVSMVQVVDNVANYTDAAHIPDWSELKSTMLALGGKWRTKKGFIFPDDIDAAERVRLAVATGEILDPKAASFFPTPDWLAEQLVARARIVDGHTVLEPSAGAGAIALAVRRACPGASITCIEALPDNVSKLRAHGFSDVQRYDFLSAPLGTFDRVVMNPPFEGRADIAHVRHAFSLLHLTGVLVAVMSSGVAHRQDKLASEFRALVHANEGEIIENPEGAFLESGTGVRTVTVTMRRGAKS